MKQHLIGYLDVDGDYLPVALPERIDVDAGLSLRWWTNEDLAVRTRMITAHRADLAEFLTWAGVHSRTLEAGWLKELPVQRGRGTYHYAILAGKRPVGSFAVYLDGPQIPDDLSEFGSLSAEIGYWLIPSARGKGLATRAVNAVTSMLFSSGVGEVFARVDPENAGSRSVLNRASFVEDSEMAEALALEGLLTYYREAPETSRGGVL